MRLVSDAPARSVRVAARFAHHTTISEPLSTSCSCGSAANDDGDDWWDDDDDYGSGGSDMLSNFGLDSFTDFLENPLICESSPNDMWYDKLHK